MQSTPHPKDAWSIVQAEIFPSDLGEAVLITLRHEEGRVYCHAWAMKAGVIKMRPSANQDLPPPLQPIQVTFVQNAQNPSLYHLVTSPRSTNPRI